jgi:hypothetical protein
MKFPRTLPSYREMRRETRVVEVSELCAPPLDPGESHCIQGFDVLATVQKTPSRYQHLTSTA